MNRIKQRISSLLSAPGEELGRWKRIIRFHLRIAILCARRLRDQNAMEMSAALSFRTILTLIPTLVLSVLLLRSMGAFDSAEVVNWVFSRAGLTKIVVTRGDRESGAATRPAQSPQTQPAGAVQTQTQPDTQTTQPAKVYNLADELQRLIQRVERKVTLGVVGPVGAVLMIWTALTLMMTIERALNRIFDAPRSRSFWKRILTYWTALTLGPLVLAAANYIGGELGSLAGAIPGVSWLLATTGWLQGIVIGLLFLAAVYKLVPNTQVSFRAALGGAIVAGPLWMLARWAFTLYVVGLVGRPSLYGAIGLAPLFLIWLNMTMYIFLFGATIAYAGQNVASFNAMQSAAGDNRDLFTWADSLAVLVAIYRAFRAERGPITRTELSKVVRIDESRLQALIQDLAHRDLICPTKTEEDVILSPEKPAKNVLLGPLLGPRKIESRGYEQSLQLVICAAMQTNADALKTRTLEDVLQLADADNV